jgi:hypothetical protein
LKATFGRLLWGRGTRLLRIEMLFVMDGDVLSVSVGIVEDILAYLSARPEDSEGGYDRDYSRQDEDARKEDGEEVTEDIDEKAQAYEHQAQEKRACGEMPGGVRERVGIEPEVHNYLLALK